MKFLRMRWLSLRDLLVASGPTLVILILAVAVGYRLADPAPPRLIDMSTGQKGSDYHVFAQRYAKELKKNQIELRFVESAGSTENLQRISDPDSEIEVGFVQSGSTAVEQAEEQGLVSLGSLFYEPIWIFYRSKTEWTSLRQLQTKRVNLGPPGTGMASLMGKLLQTNQLALEDLQISRLNDQDAAAALLDGKLDVLVLTSAGESPIISELLQNPQVRLFDFVQAEAYTRRLPFLSHVILPRGIVDIGKDIPARDYHMLAPTATLVAHDSLHPALMGLLLQAAASIHSKPDWFSRVGDFPNAQYSEIPVAEAAQKFYKNGAPVLQRYLSFWVANFIERTWVILVALGALILPLSKIVPPIYVWRIRSRIYRWYGQLRLVEQALLELDNQAEAKLVQQQIDKLDEIEATVNQLNVPLAYAEELYGLRSHIAFVRERLRRLL